MSTLPITEEQQEALKVFKESLIAKNAYDLERHSDFLLHRFLRARKYDLLKAEQMFLNCEIWRRVFDVDKCVNTFAFPEKDAVFEVYPQYFHKLDKLGRTVYIEQFKNMDMNKLFKITTQERLVARHIREYEKFTRYRLAACSVKKGENVENGTTIIDLKGVPLSQFNSVRKIIQTLSDISSNYYPETMGKMFVINAPTLFTAVWSILKSMLDEHTVGKIQIIGSNYQKILLEHIDAANLPEYLGGSCKCPGGCDKSDLGPWNDGSVPGYPIAMWEDMKLRDRVTTDMKDFDAKDKKDCDAKEVKTVGLVWN
jgi:hypothetical protein